MSQFNLNDGTWSKLLVFTEKEAQGFCQFMVNHGRCFFDKKIYISSASGIGQNIVVVCGCDKNSQWDITDYGSW